jgi:hypothetical protein
MSDTRTIRSMSDALHHERHIQEEQERYETKRVKAEKYGESDAPSAFMMSSLIQDIRSTTTGILGHLVTAGEAGEAPLAEACHILARTFSELSTIERKLRAGGRK